MQPTYPQRVMDQDFLENITQTLNFISIVLKIGSNSAKLIKRSFKNTCIIHATWITLIIKKALSLASFNPITRKEYPELQLLGPMLEWSMQHSVGIHKIWWCTLLTICTKDVQRYGTLSQNIMLISSRESSRVSWAP